MEIFHYNWTCYHRPLLQGIRVIVGSDPSHSRLVFVSEASLKLITRMSSLNYGFRVKSLKTPAI